MRFFIENPVCHQPKICQTSGWLVAMNKRTLDFQKTSTWGGDSLLEITNKGGSVAPLCFQQKFLSRSEA